MYLVIINDTRLLCFILLVHSIILTITITFTIIITISIIIPTAHTAGASTQHARKVSPIEPLPPVTPPLSQPTQKRPVPVEIPRPPPTMARAPSLGYVSQFNRLSYYYYVSSGHYLSGHLLSLDYLA